MAVARPVLALFLPLLLCAPLFAQDEEPDRRIPGEALRRKRQDVAAVQARSPDPEMQEQALDLMETILVTGDEEFTRRNEEILSHLLVPPRVRGDSAAGASYAHVRIRAARIAGRLDTRGAAQTLMEVLTSDADAAVVAAAAGELSRMTYVDSRALAARYGELLMRENVGNRRDSRLATELIRGALVLYNQWRIEDPVLVRAILEARNAPYSRETRQMAGRFVEAVLEG
jgi:hypothetical protein